jgi:hypothetical protein
MPEIQAEYSREEFYDLIWTTRESTIFAELRSYALNLKALCQKFNVPMPGDEYWAAVRAKQTPERVALPVDTRPEVQTIVFGKEIKAQKRATEEAEEREFSPEFAALLRAAREMPLPEVGEKLVKPHPLVAFAYDHYRSKEPSAKVKVLPIYVTPKALLRALCLMDALIKRVEALGGSVSVNGEEQAVIQFLGYQELISLAERSKRVYQDVPANAWGSRPYQMVPTGQLYIATARTYGDYLLVWSPTRRDIDLGVHKLVIRLITTMAKSDSRAQQRRAEELAERQQAHRQEELQAKQKQEQAEVDQLIKNAQDWELSQTLNAYLDAACEMVLLRDGKIDLDGRIAKYLRWARDQAKRLDPLTPSPPSVLDEHL